VQVVPQKIKLAAGNNTLTIQWSDGHLSAYRYQHLRDGCPCATCRDAGRPKPAAASPLKMYTRALRPARAELVGRYALQIYWSDGHSSGIYSFEYLRSLCPCAECAARQNVPADRRA